MLKIDWFTIILIGMIISLVTEYWHGQHMFLRFEKYLLKKDLKILYKFFYCRFCVIGKLSIFAALLIRPADIMIIMPYKIWLLFVYSFNFIIINFVALALDGLIMNFAMKNIFKRQDEEYELVATDVMDKGLEKYNKGNKIDDVTKRMVDL